MEVVVDACRHAEVPEAYLHSVLVDDSVEAVCELVAGVDRSLGASAQVAEVVQDEEFRLLVLARHHELALHVEGVE